MESLPLQSQINIYTDGSKTKTHRGLGYTIIKGNNTVKEGSRRLPNENTVFQAELMAIKLAMEDLEPILTEQDRYLKIFSDSQAAIQGLNSNSITSQLVKDTITSLSAIGNRVHKLEIIWIKAHVGHPGNERADQLARDATQLENIHSTEILTPYSHFKKQLLDTTYALWKDEWSTQQTCRLSKNFLPYTSKHKSK